MSDNVHPQDTPEVPPEETYRVSDRAKEQLARIRGKPDLERRSERRARWLLNRLRARDKNPIKGYLIAHRRQFGVSHKSVQDKPQ